MTSSTRLVSVLSVLPPGRPANDVTRPRGGLTASFALSGLIGAVIENVEGARRVIDATRGSRGHLRLLPAAATKNAAVKGLRGAEDEEQERKDDAQIDEAHGDTVPEAWACAA